MSTTTKPAFVFIHAFPLNASMWRHQVAFLQEKGFAVFAPDLPGFKGVPLCKPDLNEYAKYVLEKAKKSGVERSIVVGLSMGGYIAFRLLENEPDFVAGLVLADTRAIPDGEEAKHNRTTLAEQVIAKGIGFLKEKTLPNLLGKTTFHERQSVVQDVAKMIEEASVQGVANALLAMRDRPDSSPLLSKIAVPTLVVVGDEDALISTKEASAMASSVNGAKLVVIKEAGHLTALEQADAFSKALFDFYQENF
jgi:3-oxoadipate enol-lactonase